MFDAIFLSTLIEHLQASANPIPNRFQLTTLISSELPPIRRNYHNLKILIAENI